MLSFKQFISEKRSKVTQNRGSLPKLFIDMDGVLVDFIAGVGNILGMNNAKRNTTLDKHEWQAIKDVENFWIDLPKLRGTDQLWNFVKKFRPDILSAAPADWPEAKIQKTQWLKNNLGGVSGKIHIVQRKDKVNFAERNVLIDDFDKNIKEWEAAGGIGILYKSPTQVIRELKKLGFE
jgi:phosphoglycolate phosphatase-like HAD superfamily hydrolase